MNSQHRSKNKKKDKRGKEKCGNLELILIGLTCCCCYKLSETIYTNSSEGEDQTLDAHCEMEGDDNVRLCCKEIICTNESSVLKYYCVKVYNGYEDPTTEKLSPMPIRTIFFPIWLFHTVVARGRFSLPAPAVPYNRHDTSKFTKAYTREDRRLRAGHLQVRVQATIRSQVEDGSVVIEGSSDILSMALGSSESVGHVRGIGFGVTPTAYFDLPRRGSKRYIKELESRLQEEREKRKKAEQMLIADPSGGVFILDPMKPTKWHVLASLCCQNKVEEGSKKDSRIRNYKDNQKLLDIENLLSYEIYEWKSSQIQIIFKLGGILNISIRSNILKNQLDPTAESLEIGQTGSSRRFIKQRPS
ncbi:hypothetical protein LguiA_016412 [Lonicera macranthoides]